MKTQPLVSILMPAFNAEKYIRDAIDSIIHQTYNNIEILIAEDNSSDATKYICREYSEKFDFINIFYNQENRGYLYNINYLFKKAKGDFIGFMDADDTCSHEKIEKQIAFLLENDFDAVGTNCKIIDNNGKFIRNVKYKEIFDRNRITSVNACGSSIIFKRKIVEEIGFFNPFFDRIGSEDLEWLTRVNLFYKFKNINEYLYNYRKTENSITTDINSSLSLKRSISHKSIELILNQCIGINNKNYWENKKNSDKIQSIFKHLEIMEYSYPINVLCREVDSCLYIDRIKAIKIIFKFISKHGMRNKITILKLFAKIIFRRLI